MVASGNWPSNGGCDANALSLTSRYDLCHLTPGETEMNLTPVGIDIAKRVFQIHFVDAATGEVINKPIKRAKLLEHFANRAPCLIGMEACGGSQHWARQLVALGHEVKLMPAEFVKAFNIRNKNDA